jgi:hypothetical protein
MAMMKGWMYRSKEREISEIAMKVKEMRTGSGRSSASSNDPLLSFTCLVTKISKLFNLTSY